MKCKNKLGDYNLKEGVQRDLSKVVAKDKGKQFYDNMKAANIKV